MDGSTSSLAALELYVNELFSGNANKEQIQKIHQALDSFSRQKGAWKDALYFLSQTTNPQTAMYSLTVLEGFITKGWNGLSSEEQIELRTTLCHWLLEKHQFSPYFIRNKAVQLVVHIARSDWPQKYPDFFTDVLMLVSSPNTSSTILGLLFLQTASEELGTPRDGLLYSRKAELKQRLLQLIPNTLAILTGLLQAIWEKRSHSITSTPPPSPTNSLPSEISSPRQHLSSGKNSSHSLNSEMEPVARLALQCLTHLFTWIPLSSHVTPQLMELIFRFVGMGTEQTLPVMSTCNELSVPVVALGTINEILYKNCVPAEFENFVVLLFNNCCIILHHFVNNLTNGHLPQQPRPQFMEKLVELVHLLMSNHLRRLEGRLLPQFSVPQFLSLFFTFTFKQADWGRYASCLDTWQVFLSYVKQSSNTSGSQPSSNGDSLAVRYQESLVTLSEHVLRKILFSSNGTQLEELDDEAIDGNMETERQKIQLQSIEIFVTAGELVRNQTLSLLNEPFQRCTSAYRSLTSLSTTGNNVVRLESKEQLKEMLMLLNDLAMLIQLIGRLSELHTGPDYCTHFEMGKALVGKLVDLASYGSLTINLNFVGLPGDELKSTLSLVHAQVLSSLQAWCHWISIWAHGDGPKEPVNSLVAALVASAVDVFSPTWSNRGVSTGNLKENGREKVYQAGLQLLSSIVSVIRTSNLWNCPSWNEIYHSVYDIDYLQPTIHRELMRCVLGSAIVTWRNCTVEEQHWEERQSRLQLTLERVTQATRIIVQELRREPLTALLAQGKPIVISTITLLADLAGLARDETTASKAALYSALGPWIEPTLILLSYYIHDAEVTETIFQFYVAVFDSLLSQVGIARAEKAVQTFLEIFQQQNIQVILQQDNLHGIRAVEQLLRILQIVVQEPGNAFKRFLPNTLSLCLDHIHPCITQINSSEIKETFYHLLTLILRHHWRSFFKGSVLTTYGSPELDRAEQMDNQPQFIAIMTSFGQSFLLPDITIFKQNLEALESLQSKWKLYHKAVFRDGIASQFISTLLNVLTNGSHELLREEVGLAIYAMASPDFEVFFQQFLPTYLLNCQGIEDYQRIALKNAFTNDTDLPSFTQNVHRLTNDLRCFRSTNISNASLYQC
ncbi:exportin-6-like [Daphnia carinata]|uniref:exportin-6-like n=1 Tax=Daphnia carinata TaxID=120202 RepID=UPI00257F8AB2|nr:exportin-6-like [Daphnia carinata]